MHLKVFVKLKTLKTLSSGQKNPKKPQKPKKTKKKPKKPTGLGYLKKNLGFFQPCSPAYSVMPSVRPFSTPSTGNWVHTPYPFLPQPTQSCCPSGPSPPPLQVLGAYPVLHIPSYPSLRGHAVFQALLHPLYR
jgi:hypothetical protein